MATCEYQEARMEAKGAKEVSKGDKSDKGECVDPKRRDTDIGGKNWDRRSLRIKNKDKIRERRRNEPENEKNVCFFIH